MLTCITCHRALTPGQVYTQDDLDNVPFGMPTAAGQEQHPTYRFHVARAATREEYDANNREEFGHLALPADSWLYLPYFYWVSLD